MSDAPLLPPALVLTQQQIGGSGKTFVSQIAIDAAIRAGIDLTIFENDGQTVFDCHGGATRIVLPATEEVVHDPLADVRAHAPLSAALTGLEANAMVFYDGCAASLNRHTFGIQYTNIPERLVAMGRHMVVLLVVSARPDIAREGLICYEVWRDMLGAPHRVIPVVSERDGSTKSLPAGHDVNKLVKMAADGVITLPRIPMPVINEARRTGMRLSDLGDPRNPLDTPDIAGRTGQDAATLELVRRCIGEFLVELDPQLQRLGFPLGL